MFSSKVSGRTIQACLLASWCGPQPLCPWLAATLWSLPPWSPGPLPMSLRLFSSSSQHSSHIGLGPTLLMSPSLVSICIDLIFSSVQFSRSVASDFVTPRTAASQASLSITSSRSLPKLMSIDSVMPSNHLILCRPRLRLPPIPPSIRVFSSESALCSKWQKYWSFSFSISPFNEHPGLISFRMDWLDLLAVQGTLKSLLQHHSSKASILLCSAFFTVQLSHPFMTTGKTIALTRQTFVDKVVSLLFNMWSRFQVSSNSQVLGVRTSPYLWGRHNLTCNSIF